MKISRVTGFPFHPPADKQEGTIHVLERILHARSIIVTRFMAIMRCTSNAGEDCKVAGAPDIVDSDALNAPRIVQLYQFNVIAVFHEVMARMIVARQMLRFHDCLQPGHVAVKADTWIAYRVRGVEVAQRFRQGRDDGVAARQHRIRKAGFGGGRSKIRHRILDKCRRQQRTQVAVEYSVTPLGRTLEEPFRVLYAWTVHHAEAVMQAQAAFDRRAEIG
jgi:hypothetical protein